MNFFEGLEQIKEDKYKDKPIRFYKKEDRYELIFSGDFQQADQENPSYADLLMDLKDADKSKQIHVWIHSTGGSCTTLMLIGQQLDQFEYVVTIGLGQIDSAGFMLWTCGDERYLSDTTCCMYHSMSSGYEAKEAEMKEYSLFLEKYQYIFQKTAEKVLTKEQVQKGKYTEIWLIGKELIDRGVAINYKKYSNRKIPKGVEAFTIDNDVYLKTNNGNYEQVITVEDECTKKQLMKKYLYSQEKQDKYTKAKQVFGEVFLGFISNWLNNKSNLFAGDGFISNDFLEEQWKLYTDENMSLSKLKDNIEKWIKFFELEMVFQKNAVCGKKKGVFLKLKCD